MARKKGKKTLVWYPMSAKSEKTMKEFILWLYKGFKEYGLDVNNEGGDQYTDHVFYVAIREITRMIGECRNFNISQEARKLLDLGVCPDHTTLQKARKNHPRETVKEHVKPAGDFIEEFRVKKTSEKDFTQTDAARWFKQAKIAIISKAEDNRLTAKGWRDKRPDDAYDRLEPPIVLEKIKIPEPEKD